jgi:hypothetical protein
VESKLTEFDLVKLRDALGKPSLAEAVEAVERTLAQISYYHLFEESVDMNVNGVKKLEIKTWLDVKNVSEPKS